MYKQLGLNFILYHPNSSSFSEGFSLEFLWSYIETLLASVIFKKIAKNPFFEVVISLHGPTGPP